MTRNHVFVFFAIKCTICGWFYISYNEKKSVNAVFPPYDMAFQNLLIWRQYRSLCLSSSLAASLMSVASLLTMLPHQSCHLWIPASNDSKVITKFHWWRPQMQILPSMCREMWMMIHSSYVKFITWNFANYTWKKVSSNHIWNSFSHNHCISRTWPLSVLIT